MPTPPERQPGKIKHPPVRKGENTREILKSIGKEDLVQELIESKIISEG